MYFALFFVYYYYSIVDSLIQSSIAKVLEFFQTLKEVGQRVLLVGNLLG